MIELLHTDCMSYMATLPDAAFDLAIVDPPYGINADEVQNIQARNGRVSNGGKWKEYKQTKWDAEVPNQEYFAELRRVSKNQIVWGGNYYNLHLPGVVVWYKGKNGTMKDGELAKCSMNTFKVFELSRVDAYINCQSVKIHPTQKPVKLYEWLLQQYAQPGMKVLDTHLGSGSAAIAAHYAGVDFVGCEIDADYWSAAKERFEAETRQMALLAPNVQGQGDGKAQL